MGTDMDVANYYFKSFKEENINDIRYSKCKKFKGLLVECY